MCSVKKVFLEILQNSEESICARDFFLIKLQALFHKATQDNRFWQSGNFLDLFQISHYLEKSQNH